MAVRLYLQHVDIDWGLGIRDLNWLLPLVHDPDKRPHTIADYCVGYNLLVDRRLNSKEINQKSKKGNFVREKNCLCRSNEIENRKSKRHPRTTEENIEHFFYLKTKEFKNNGRSTAKL